MVKSVIKVPCPELEDWFEAQVKVVGGDGNGNINIQDLDDTPPTVGLISRPTSTSPAVKEKHASVGTVGEPSSSVQNGHTSEPTQSSDQTSDPSASSTVDLVTAIDLTITLTPSKTLLPGAPPEGVTSGAVQPPGSKGDDNLHTRTHSQDSGDEPDATRLHRGR